MWISNDKLLETQHGADLYYLSPCGIKINEILFLFFLVKTTWVDFVEKIFLK